MSGKNGSEINGKSCEYFAELISLETDGLLSENEQSELERHLEHCPDCRRTKEAFEFLRDSAGMLEAEPPEGFAASVMEKIRLEAEEDKLASVQTGKTGWQRFVPQLALVAGAAAIFAVVMLSPAFRPASSAAPNGAAGDMALSDMTLMQQSMSGESEEADGAEITGYGLTRDAGDADGAPAPMSTMESGEADALPENSKIKEDEDNIAGAEGAEWYGEGESLELGRSIYYIEGGKLYRLDPRTDTEIMLSSPLSDDYTFIKIAASEDGSLLAIVLDGEGNELNVTISADFRDVDK